MVRISILPGEMTRKLKILLGWFGWWWWSEDEEEEAHGAELFEWMVVGLKVQDLPGEMWRLGETDTATATPTTAEAPTKVVVLLQLLLLLRFVVYPMFFKGFTHPRWCRISSINSITTTKTIAMTIWLCTTTNPPVFLVPLHAWIIGRRVVCVVLYILHFMSLIVCYLYNGKSVDIKFDWDIINNRFLKSLHRRITDHQAPQATTFGKKVAVLAIVQV